MTEMQTPKRASAGGLKWAFGISLALNLVFIGVFAGAALRFSSDDRGGHGAGPRSPSYGAPFLRALPLADQRKLRSALKANTADLPTRAERRVLRQQLIDAMRAPTFDASLIVQLFAAQNEAAQKMLGTAQSAWLDLVREMSEGERAAVADKLEERMKRRGYKAGKRP